jgi:hypothetical protein
MNAITIEQAIYGSLDAGGYRFLARSPGFLDDWLDEAQRLCTGFGERPAGVACPLAVFAQPFGRRYVAVVQVADQGTDDAGRPGALGFHLLVLPRAAHRALGGDPFFLAERFPPTWHVRDDLPSLSCPVEPAPSRSVEQVQRVLKRPDGPNLLGGSQVLVDGGRVVFERRTPDLALLRDLWTLLPSSARSELWPASFAFGNALRFHALAVPHPAGDDYVHYHSEEQAGEYPEGRYELSLQTAAEAGDQRELDRLFARRSQADTMRLGIYILAVAIVISLLVGLLNPKPPPAPPNSKQPSTGKEQPPPTSKLDLPPPDQYPSLSRADVDRLTRELSRIASQAGVPPRADIQVRQIALATAQSGPNCLAAPPLLSQELTASLTQFEGLLDGIDRHLGTPNAGRDPGFLCGLGPPERQLRALLWKHGVAAYNDPRLNSFELLERLERVLETVAPTRR